jgi:hypothetical protein
MRQNIVLAILCNNLSIIYLRILTEEDKVLLRKYHARYWVVIEAPTYQN